MATKIPSEVIYRRKGAAWLLLSLRTNYNCDFIVDEFGVGHLDPLPDRKYLAAVQEAVKEYCVPSSNGEQPMKWVRRHEIPVKASGDELLQMRGDGWLLTDTIYASDTKATMCRCMMVNPCTED